MRSHGSKNRENCSHGQLGRNEDSTYSELRNYAVWERTEPGSTMKLLSTMALLETGKADTNTKVDTENGVIQVFDRKVRDSRRGGYGEISLGEAFEKSSNTAIVKLIYSNFKDEPSNLLTFYTLVNSMKRQE